VEGVLKTWVTGVFQELENGDRGRCAPMCRGLSILVCWAFALGKFGGGLHLRRNPLGGEPFTLVFFFSCSLFSREPCFELGAIGLRAGTDRVNCGMGPLL